MESRCAYSAVFNAGPRSKATTLRPAEVSCLAKMPPTAPILELERLRSLDGVPGVDVPEIETRPNVISWFSDTQVTGERQQP